MEMEGEILLLWRMKRTSESSLEFHSIQHFSECDFLEHCLVGINTTMLIIGVLFYSSPVGNAYIFVQT